ncbi:endonuclease NucS [Corynebacterium bovis]|uniref:Endonuclease NucS n=1 Tax=Corynebacterium bovis TaxID=36808 RepID=A0A3R8PDW2_9CORY|nr:endonuclease NucS [Corynebacterium bovis]MDN8579576.1 endonuclease NucS [Corynebacterium bovis]RRO87815.1 endonuclease NucS [Corynebacterium bovis]RRO90141.1 endonuclease NucS [Corynebacterium bovis]
MRLVIARCSVDYVGRLEAHLPEADRLIMVKADGSVSVHADDRAYKPLNWMTPPCTFTEESVEPVDPAGPGEEAGSAEGAPAADRSGTAGAPGDAGAGAGPDPASDPEAVARPEMLWTVRNPKGEELRISVYEVHSDTSFDLGVDPGLVKDGVEAHLQELLAEQIELLGEGYTLVRREFPTAIGPVDILSRDAAGRTVAVEIKRRAGIDGVEQLTRYVELLNRDELLAPVEGVLAAQEIRPQARTLAEDRGLRCLTLDYAAMRGTESPELRLF